MSPPTAQASPPGNRGASTRRHPRGVRCGWPPPPELVRSITTGLAAPTWNRYTAFGVISLAFAGSTSSRQTPST
jgi:hypothetical protein